MPSNSIYQDTPSSDLTTYNRTELYQLCRKAGVQVAPHMESPALVDALNGVGAPGHNPIDPLRQGIMAFLLEHWKRASSQLTCPAKSGDKNACYSCVDAQVIHCLTTNPRIVPGVVAHVERGMK